MINLRIVNKLNPLYRVKSPISLRGSGELFPEYRCEPDEVAIRIFEDQHVVELLVLNKVLVFDKHQFAFSDYFDSIC